MENLSNSIVKLAENGYPEIEIHKICCIIWNLKLIECQKRIDNIIKEGILKRKNEYLEKV